MFSDQREGQTLLCGVGVVLGSADSLGIVDAGVSGKEVAKHASDRRIGSDVRAEQLQ